MRLKIVINVRRIVYVKVTCRLTQKFHKTTVHDEMTEIFQCYKLPVNRVIFARLFSVIVNEITTLRVMYDM